MTEMQTLEELASQLGAMFSESQPAQPNSIEVAGKTAGQLKGELAKVNAAAEETAHYFNARLQELEALLDKPFDLASTSMLRDASGLIVDIRKAGASFESAMQEAKKVQEGLQAKTAFRIGF